MLVLECTWQPGETDFAVLGDAVGMRGRVTHAHGVWYGVWRKTGNVLLVCGQEAEWAPRDTEPIPQQWDALLNRVVYGMFVAEALAGRPHRPRLGFGDKVFRVVDMATVPGLDNHVKLALESTDPQTVRHVLSEPHGLARVAPGRDESTDSYAAHVEWGPVSRPLAIINGPDNASWEDTLRWARRWAHTALARHARKPAERLDL